MLTDFVKCGNTYRIMGFILAFDRDDSILDYVILAL